MFSPELSAEQIEFLIDLVMQYQETNEDRMNQVQWAESQSVLDILDEWLTEAEDG